MNGTYYYVIIVFVILTAGLAIWYLSMGVKRIFQSGVKKKLNDTRTMNRSTIGAEDMAHLPDPVQKYLHYVGIVGKERVYSLRMVCNTDINMGEKAGWSKMKTVEYDFFDEEPTRLAFMKFVAKGLPIVGLDSFVDGKGRMLMKVCGLFKLGDAYGNEMDNSSAAVMLLLSMCTGAPAALIDDRIKWATIDPLTVLAEFSNKGVAISARMKFNEAGELIDFSTEDKYYSPSGKSYDKVRWSTPVLHYRMVNGLKLPTYGEAIWHFPKGDWCYGKNTLVELEYNCNK